ncbi:PQQ-dependent sugar dehydrogenase [Verrucomicrobiota bacterium sgz303538]
MKILRIAALLTAACTSVGDFAFAANTQAPPVQTDPPSPHSPCTNPEHPLTLEPVATGLSIPIFAVPAPGDRRLFVLEKGGRIRIVSEKTVLPTPFLDLTEVVDSMGERGLLGLAFDPNYAQNRRFYVCYSDAETTDTIISRFTVSADPSVADRLSEQKLLRIPQHKELADHKAGWIAFRAGEPNNLYIAVGDGGGSNNADNSAQDLHSNRGKILRIDVSGSGPGYSIPADNPFVGSSDANPEIWAYGLRNPYRASFDRLTGDLYIGDVGQDTAEEINFEESSSRGGRNYGWRQLEGHCRNLTVSEPAAENVTPPIFDYLQADMPSTRGAVIGGYVYRGRAMPDWYGTYFFADFTNAAVRSFHYDGRKVTQYTDHTAQLNPGGQFFFYSSVTSFAEDADGELLLIDFTGSIFRLAQAAAPSSPKKETTMLTGPIFAF